MASKKQAQRLRSRIGGKRSASRKTHVLFRAEKKRGFAQVPYSNPKRKRKRSRNPKQLLFRTKVAAVKYAREHGAKKFSVRKLKRAS
jgi:hypothetical protein